MKKLINQQSSSDSNDPLLETACLFWREAKIRSKHFNYEHADLQSCWGLIFSFPQISAALPMSLLCQGCWADGCFLSRWALLPAGGAGCRQCYIFPSKQPRHVATSESGGGGCCAAVPGIQSLLDWHSTAEGLDIPCEEMSVKGAGC